MHLVETPADVAALSRKDPNRLAFVTQTTLSVDDASVVIDSLKARFPAIVGPKKDDICYATQNRQDAVKALSRQCDVVIVVGSPNSSNSNRLREVAENLGVPAYMVDRRCRARSAWVEGKAVVGVTAGASAPDVLVRGRCAAPLRAGRDRSARDGRHLRERRVPAAEGAVGLSYPRSAKREEAPCEHGASLIRHAVGVQVLPPSRRSVIAH